jgi:hypothetical protein
MVVIENRSVDIFLMRFYVPIMNIRELVRIDDKGKQGESACSLKEL